MKSESAGWHGCRVGPARGRLLGRGRIEQLRSNQQADERVQLCDHRMTALEHLLRHCLRSRACIVAMRGVQHPAQLPHDGFCRQGRICNAACFTGTSNGTVEDAPMAMAASEIETADPGAHSRCRGHDPRSRRRRRPLRRDRDRRNRSAASPASSSTRSSTRRSRAEMGGKLHALALQTGTPER